MANKNRWNEKKKVFSLEILLFADVIYDATSVVVAAAVVALLLGLKSGSEIKLLFLLQQQQH